MKAVCGLDVHKDSIFLCIFHSDGELFEQVFGVLTFQLEEMPYSVIGLLPITECIFRYVCNVTIPLPPLEVKN